jgi:hypothetical protein
VRGFRRISANQSVEDDTHLSVEDNLFFYKHVWSVPQIMGDNVDSLNNSSYSIILKDATAPTVTINKESYQSASLEYKFAKSVTWDDIKLVFYDTIGLTAQLLRWRSLVWDPENGLKSDYKKDTILKMSTASDDQDFLNKTWTLYGSWPSIIRYGDLTYTSSDVVSVELTLTYDYAVESDT